MYNKTNPHVAKELILQGDVAGRYIAALPKSFTPIKDNIIARGEVTGHHHILEGNVVTGTDEFGNLFSLIKEPVMLLHQEHQAWVLHPGVIQWGEKGVMQVEYDGEEERRAMD